MRADTKSELQMLREVVWLICPRMCCDFCKEPLFMRPDKMTFGHRRHGRLPVRLTVHHGNHNRADNRDVNLHLVHSECHDEYHAWCRRVQQENKHGSEERQEEDGRSKEEQR